MIDRDAVKEALTGPISSIRTPFRTDGSVDTDGLKRVVDANIAGGSRTMLLTAGDSHYIALSDAEIAEVSRIVVDAAAGRAMVVTADRQFQTRQAVAFASYAAEIGADVHMVLPPDWAASCTPETLCEHYARVADILPVMIVTGVFSSRGEAFGLETLAMVRDRVENVVAIKDDMLGPFARKMTAMLHDDWAVFSGGQKQNHLDLYPYGCHGFMSTFITFEPDITRRYWSAIQANDVRAAARVIRDYDHPLFDLLKRSTGGFDAALRGIFEIYGIAKRWRPAPYYSLSDAEMEGLEEAVGKLVEGV